MLKKQRQAVIIDIIRSKEVSTQEMLRAELEAVGINVTQATLSRDINELNLKKESSGVYRYFAPLKETMECPAILKDSITDIVYAMNTVVIKCHTGMAQAACATLDKMQCTGIVGTIAGDDTIFVLMPDTQAAEKFCISLREMIL